MIEKVNKYLLVAFAFALPFKFNISSIIGFLLIFLFFIDFKNLKERIKIVFSNKLSLIVLSVFFIHLLGLLYTSNFKYALTDLEIKLPLFLFPIIIFSGIKIDFSILKKVFVSFISGCFLASLFCIYNSYTHFLISADYKCFFYDGLSFFMHTSYFSMFLTFAQVLLFFLLIKSREGIKGFFINFSVIVLFTYFSLFILFLSSKAGIIVSLAAVFLLFLYYLLIKKDYWLSAVFPTVVLFILIISPVIAPHAFKRFEITSNQVLQKNDNVVNNSDVNTNESMHLNSSKSNDDVNSKEERLVIWKTAIKTAKKNPVLGVGTGDIKDELIKAYEKINFKNGIIKKLNCHNQYLQFLMAFGLLGLICILFSFLYPLLNAFKTKDYIYLFFAFVFFANVLFESMLETKTGVEFFAFFNSLLIAFSMPIKNKLSKLSETKENTE